MDSRRWEFCDTISPLVLALFLVIMFWYGMVSNLKNISGCIFGILLYSFCWQITFPPLFHLYAFFLHRHEKPTDPDDPLADQNIKDRYYGINDPVADKLLKRASTMPRLDPPEDKTITTLYVGGLGDTITETDLRFVSVILRTFCFWNNSFAKIKASMIIYIKYMFLQLLCSYYPADSNVHRIGLSDAREVMFTRSAYPYGNAYRGTNSQRDSEDWPITKYD